MNIAEEIRSELGRKKITYPAFSRMTGMTEATVYRKIRNEESPLDIVQLEKCASALGTTAGELMRRAEQRAEENEVNTA